jgi:ribokinase
MAAARKKSPVRHRVAVVGSLNLDHFARVETLPKPGETVAADRLTHFQGGKGANQAVAAARQGCAVVLFGAVGADEAGAAYLRALEEEGVSTFCVRTVRGPTGAAFITVDHHGENMIVVAPGANAELRRRDIAREAARIEECDILVGQFEVPAAALVEAAHIANRAGIPVLINPSPFLPAFPWEEIRTDYLVVNETEALELLGFPPSPALALEVRDRLHELRTAHLIVTRGGEETLVFNREGEIHAVPVLPVLPVDTVGAGDAFAGCLAARLAQGDYLDDALRAANCAGALTTLGSGAQGPMPDREQVDRHLQFLDS